MARSIISEGKTTNEAIEKGLKELKVSKKMVDIKVLETPKRSFFSILAPRIVKVELTIKEENIQESKKETKSNNRINNKNNTKNENQIQNIESKSNIKNENKEFKGRKKEFSNNLKPYNRPERKEIILTEEQQNKAYANIDNFLKEFIKYLPDGTQYEIEKTTSVLKVNISSTEMGYLIGFRGETLNALQNILSAMAGKDVEEKVRVILDISGYKIKRQQTLEELAKKVAETVIKNKKSYTLEPMEAYERKIIHSALQDNPNIETRSIGEEPRRRVVIYYKK